MNLKPIQSLAWAEPDALKSMEKGDDVWRGFMHLPDMSGDLDVELYLRHDGILEVTVILADDENPPSYDPNFGNDIMCQCGHVYRRHFDTYDNMAPVGCKYCIPLYCPEFSKRVIDPAWFSINGGNLA